MIAARRYGLLHPVHTTPFEPVLDADRCRGCGRCVSACPVQALSMVSAHDPSRPARKQSSLDPRVCLGCGVCVRACRHRGIRLERRAERLLTPVDTAHRVVLMALERGRLADLVFDRQGAGHRAMAAVLGAILALPPLQRALASEQARSRYLAALIESRRRAPA